MKTFTTFMEMMYKIENHANGLLRSRIKELEKELAEAKNIDVNVKEDNKVLTLDITFSAEMVGQILNRIDALVKANEELEKQLAEAKNTIAILQKLANMNPVAVFTLEQLRSILSKSEIRRNENSTSQNSNDSC